MKSKVLKDSNTNLLCPKLLTVLLISVAPLLTKDLYAGVVNKHDSALQDISPGGDWPAFNRTYGEQHFSPLIDINADNVSRLGLAWSMDLDVGNPVTGPLEVGGTVYFASGYSVVHAVNAETGKLLWKHDPKVAEQPGIRMRQGWGSRGLAWWNDKLYVGTNDGRLIALDAATGKELWSVNTLSEVKVNGMFITGAPRVFDGKVIIGNGGADHTDARGFVTTYDAETGKQLWRFYTVPGNPADGFENKAMEMAAKTWHGEWWKHGGGGTVWNAMTYDPEFGTILLGTGNGSPWNRKARSADKGDNLFLCSVVALDAKTGEYRWHYQINPGETWDYNAAMDIQLGEIQVDGKARKVLVTAPKNGFFYVIDRADGKLISAEKYTKVTWAEKIDLKTGRPVENPASRYPDGTTFTLWPSPAGAHSWLPMSFDNNKSRVFIPVIELGATYNDAGIDLKNWKHTPGNAIDPAVLMVPTLDKGQTPGGPASKLLAWDVTKQKEIWSVPTPGTWNGGVLATGGNVVFQGEITGKFKAYNADNGKLIWSFDAQSPVLAPPITYLVGSKQYVTVLTGMGTSIGAFGNTLGAQADYATVKRRVLTFELDGKATLPPTTEPAKLAAFPDPEFKTPDEKIVFNGSLAWDARCAACHGIEVVSGGHGPDLRASMIVSLGQEAFSGFVRNGNQQRGMPSYKELSDQELTAIREYIRAEAAKLRQNKN